VVGESVDPVGHDSDVVDLVHVERDEQVKVFAFGGVQKDLHFVGLPAVSSDVDSETVDSDGFSGIDGVGEKVSVGAVSISHHVMGEHLLLSISVVVVVTTVTGSTASSVVGAATIVGGAAVATATVDSAAGSAVHGALGGKTLLQPAAVTAGVE